MDTHEAKSKGTPNKGTLQSYIQDFTLEAIDKLVEIMRTSRNENLKMGAAKVIIDKSIADLKAVEVGGLNGEPIKLNIIAGADYISKVGDATATSTGSVTGRSAQVQGVSVAQASTQDNNSNQSIGKVDTT